MAKTTFKAVVEKGAFDHALEMIGNKFVDAFFYHTDDKIKEAVKTARKENKSEEYINGMQSALWLLVEAYFDDIIEFEYNEEKR